MAEERNPVEVWCGKCRHGWVAAYVPMELSKFAKLMKALHCPSCAAPSKDIFMGKSEAQTNG